jgi:peptidoglycan/LPS O-acetylase OafA/YrhL
MDHHAQFLSTRHYRSLDGLRGIAIAVVVWHHATGPRPGLLGKAFAVHLFFAISGLLITTLLLREAERTGTVSLRGFYLRRSLRIFPLYYTVLALYAVLVAALDRSPAGSAFFENLPAYLTYTANWFVAQHGPRVVFYFAWSLATEEQFYLVWPVVIRFARRWAPAVMGLLLVAGEVTLLAISRHALPRDALWVRVLASIAAPICLGCLGAFLLHSRRGYEHAERFAGRRWSAPVAAGLLVAVLACDDAPGFLVSFAASALVLTCAIREDHGLRWVLELRPLAFVGRISYGIFLLHMLAIHAARRLLPGASVHLQYLLGLALVIPLAAASLRWFEGPIARLRNRGRAPLRSRTEITTLAA